MFWKVYRKVFFFFGKYLDVYEEDLNKSIYLGSSDREVSGVYIDSDMFGVTFSFESVTGDNIAVMSIPVDVAGELYDSLLMYRKYGTCDEVGSLEFKKLCEKIEEFRSEKDKK
jgi:predicted secreted protein